MRPPVGGTGGLMPENNKGDVRNGSLVPGVALFAANLRSLVPENLHVRISDLVFLRSRGTKLRFLAEFGVPNFRSWKRAGVISRILSEKDGYRFIGR